MRRNIAIFALLVALVPVAVLAIGFGDDFSSPISTRTYVSLSNVPQGGMAHVAVEVTMRAPWHINAHELKDEFLVPTEVRFIAPEGITVTEVIYPAGHATKLDFAEEEMMLYDGTILIGAVIQIASETELGPASIKAVLDYQACDNEKCLLPASEELFIPVVVSTSRESVDLTHGEIFAKIDFAGSAGGTPAGKSGFASTIAGRGWFLGFLLVFLGGLALNLTPCVFPIIPITVSYFGGQAGGRGGKTVGLAILYLLGMAAMYSALGLIAALTGSLFGSALQNPIVTAFIALVMVALAMSMFGFYEIRIPMKLAGMAGTAKQGAAGAFAMGLTVGIVAAPCIGPFVLGLLTFVGERGDPLLGFSLFFTLALGLGAPYVFLAIASGNISKLPKSGEWMEWIRRLFGVILIGMAVYFLNPVLEDKVYWLLLGAVAIVGGIWLGWILKLSSKMVFVAALRRFVGIALPALGIYLILAPGHIRGADTHGIPWQLYDDDLLVAAKAEGKPVVIDFSAEWCLPCQELDHETFADATVIEAAKTVVPLRADLTRSADEEVKELRERYKIVGVPTVVFIDASGRERTDLRVVQFIEADEFLERLAKLTGQSLQVDARAP